MRKSYDNEILSNGSKLVAINLGSDACSEHEWGIDKLRTSFGMVDGIGIERRRVRKVPSNFQFIEKLFGQGIYYHSSVAAEDMLRRERIPETGLYTAWDDSSFAILTKDNNNQLKKLYDAVKALDIAIWLGSGGVFQNAGLVIGIISNLPKDAIKKWAKADTDKIQLTADVEKMGILERLRKADKGYFACSPSRKPDGSIQFFLNPYEQNKNYWGWVTEQDLDDWIAGKGKIPGGARKC